MSFPSDSTILDEVRIRSLLLRERYLRDCCRFDELRKAWHPDSSKTHINVAWYRGDIDNFVESSINISSGKITTIHSLDPVYIEINGSKALSESFCQMISRFEDKGSEYDKTSYCRLITRLSKIDTPEGLQWKLLTMEPIYIRDNIVPACPQPDEANPSFDSIKNFNRKGYRYLAWRLFNSGLGVQDDLSEEDDRASVRELLERNKQWITEP